MNHIDRLPGWFSRTQSKLTPSPQSLQDAAFGVLALGLAVALAFFYFANLSAFAWQKLPAFVVYVGLPATLGLLLIGAAALVMKLPRRLRLVLALVLPLMMLAVFPGGNVTGYVAGSILVFLFALLGAGGAAIWRNGFHPEEQKSALLALTIGLSGIVVCLYLVFGEKDPANPFLEDYVLVDNTLPLPNPSVPSTS